MSFQPFKKLESDVEKHQRAIELNREKIQEKRTFIDYTPSLKCENGHCNWHVQANFNPYKPLAYEPRTIILTCKECTSILFLSVKEDW